jgi:hypothetical protein
VFQTIASSDAGASSGTMSWQCNGATDDKGAFMTSSVGEVSSADALAYASVVVQPTTFDYTITDLPAVVDLGSAPLAIDAAVTLPASGNTQLAEGLLSFFGLTEASYDPQIVGIGSVGPSTLTGLAVSRTGTLDFANAVAETFNLTGSLNPNAVGRHELRAHQRVTFQIGKHIVFQGIEVDARSLTFVCTSEPLASVWVVNPDAPIARDDTADLEIAVQDEAALGGPFTLDVLSNDEPSDAAFPIDPSTLSVVSATNGLTVEAVGGKLVVTPG